MNGGQFFSVRSVRVIANGRAIMAAFVAISFLLRPRASQGLDVGVGALVAGYLVWALALAAASRSRTLVHRLLRAAVLLPALDLGVFTILLYLTSGADSPFFSPFIFLIVATTIQWGSRGAVIMGLLTLAAFAPAGWQVVFGRDVDQQAAQSFVLRVGYTGVIAAMVGAFGRHVERVVEELSRLSDPLTEDSNDAEPPIRECLRHALWVFGAERGMLLWEEADEPYAALLTYADGRFETQGLSPGGEDWIDPGVAGSVFLFHRGSGATLVRQGRRTARGPERPLAGRLLAATTFERTLVVPASTGGLTAWVFVFDHEESANEDLAIGAMVSAQVSVALERWESQRTRRAAAAAEDRIRLARDLHDGVLQFLSGAGLQLDGLATATPLPAAAQTRIATLRQAVSDEQAELRSFISTLRPNRSQRAERRHILGDELRQLAERLSRYWSIDVAAEVTPPTLGVADRFAYDLTRIVRESVANAVRHGGARKVRVVAVETEGRLRLQIDDDGRGFGLTPADERLKVDDPPRSLSERVDALSGRLELTSSGQGASVMIDVPLEAR